MFTVVDQARPWLSPNNTLAKTTQPQEGAKMMRRGTGNAADQPSSRTPRRPRRSASRPAMKLPAALTRPKLIRKEKRSEEHTSELQSHSDLVCRLLLEKKKKTP